ncbi:MAG: Omp28-related outer membrane protein, partial [Saprospiraceae bacterium]|nr:Omp28-related outer membrane protein [Saprospiraceae bacterium]
MMKRLSILALALICSFAVSAQHKRRVLIEEFTNASCGPCASQNPGFNTVVAANIQYLTPIKYQTNWPGFDPMNVQTQADVQPRVDYYGVNGVPNGRQNGTLEVFPLSQMTATSIQNAYNNLTPVTINVTHAINATIDSVLINVSVTSDAALTGNLRLRVAVVEDEIVFNTAPGSNGEKDFYQIMRKMLPNATGTATGNFAAGETKNYSFSWKLAHFYDLNQMSVAAFLQNDGTKEVYQSGRSEPLVPGIVDDNVEILAEKVFACAPGFSPSFTMTNTGTENLTSAQLRYRQGTGAWIVLDWTGDLAPGESETVTLTSIVINNSGVVNIEVGVLGSNLGIQTNLGSTGTIIKVTAAMGTAQSLPFTNAFQSAAFPPAGWLNDASASAYNWKLATNAGAASSRSARCSLFIAPQGERSFLVTPKIDMSTATSASTLTFDHAYAAYDASFWDGMSVEISADCGENWETLFFKQNQQLATAPNTTAAFVPTASQWENNEIDISAYNGLSDVLLRFVAESGYGNNLYIDNVNVNTTVGTKELTLSAFNLVPNPTRDYAEVRFGLETAQNIELRVYSAEGALVQSQLLGELTSGDHRVIMNATKLASGSYRVVLQGSEGLAQTQWVVV